MRERSKMRSGLIAGLVMAGWLVAGVAWADKPGTVPRKGGIPACEAKGS